MFMSVFCEYWQDRIIARLQQPYSLDCIPVEAEYQVGYPMTVCFCDTVDHKLFLFYFNFFFRDYFTVCEWSLPSSAIRAAHLIFLLNQNRHQQQSLSCQIAIRNYYNQKPSLLLCSHNIDLLSSWWALGFAFINSKLDLGNDIDPSVRTGIFFEVYDLSIKR
jgi:hypothetical protein